MIEVISDYMIQIKNIIDYVNDYNTIVVFYGRFRHWGHPYIDKSAGLEQLHVQTRMKNNINVEYANAPASDLEKMVLHK